MSNSRGRPSGGGSIAIAPYEDAAILAEEID
jgi:hypothetical protein